MNHELFLDQLEQTGAVLNRQVTPSMYTAYWPPFAEWTDSQFVGAITRCRQELDFFPTIKQIKERIVIQQSATEQITKSNAGLLTVEETASDKQDGSLEANVDAMTDDELIALIQADGLSEPAARATTKAFRRNQQGKLYRGYIKDLISPDWNERNEQTFRCLKCHDKGVVEVYTPQTCRKVKSGEELTTGVKTWMTACHCDRGDLHRREIKPHERGRCQSLANYEPWMIPVTAMTEDERRTEVANHYLEKKKSQGVGDFAEWS